MKEEVLVMDTSSFFLPKSLFIRKLLSRQAATQFDPLSGSYNMLRIIIIAISLILPLPSYADEGFYLLAGIGESTAKVKSKYLVNSGDDSFENLDFQLSLGYQFSNNVLIELTSISHNSFLDIGFSDSASVYENMVLLGYRFDINEKFSVTPRIGYSSWEVKSSEGVLFNPGPEATTSKKGSDLTYMLSVSYNILFMTVQSAEYDFGSLNSILIGVEFKL